MTLIYFLAGFFVFWIVLLTIVHRFEKRLVWPYGELQESMPFPDLNSYANARFCQSQEAGFHFLGWAPDVKGTIYKVSYGFTVSPERDCLVIIGSGTIMGMKLTCTWVYSATADGRLIYTTDHQGGVALDVSRRWLNQLVPGASFAQQIERHRDALRLRQFPTQPFTAGQELTEFRDLRAKFFQSLATIGYIEITDQQVGRWHYTVMGALRHAILNFAIGNLRSITMGRFPRVA